MSSALGAFWRLTVPQRALFIAFNLAVPLYALWPQVSTTEDGQKLAAVIGIPTDDPSTTAEVPEEKTVPKAPPVADIPVVDFSRLYKSAKKSDEK
jgi:hypothetical protein